ncbi:MAG: ABC transporter ATP-binding protein [Desulfatibacillum sp.]|nr:ABC transporter ATP-binding protein [Desulfatibacillum sp.]
MRDNAPKECVSAVSVRGLTKDFKVWGPGKPGFFRRFLPSSLRLSETFRSLNNVSFDVPKGTTLGIVGRNGSGKTTLLKIICGIMTPTRGEVEMRGSVSTLLELGAGFDPEFSGLENAYMNGAFMGFRKAEMDKKIPGILSFADIGEFIHRPVKTYSSGMYVRLAFAVAIHADPDILVVDETLAVGDEAFRRKCFARINQIRRNGGTVILVSHSLQNVVELCHTALWIERGRIILQGAPAFVVGEYERFANASYENQTIILDHIQKTGKAPVPSHGAPLVEEQAGLHQPRIYEHYGTRILNPRILTREGQAVSDLIMGQDYIYTYDVAFDRDAEHVRFGMMIKTQSGLEAGGAISHGLDDGIPLVKKGAVIRLRFTFKCQLTPNAYFFNAGVQGLQDNTTIFLHRVVDAVMFRVMPVKGLLATGLTDFSVHLDNTSRISIEYKDEP